MSRIEAWNFMKKLNDGTANLVVRHKLTNAGADTQNEKTAVVGSPSTVGSTKKSSDLSPTSSAAASAAAAPKPAPPKSESKSSPAPTPAAESNNNTEAAKVTGWNRIRTRELFYKIIK